MLGHRGPIALLACALVLLFVVPITTGPANEAGWCGRLLAGEDFKEPINRSALTMAFQEQRQEAACEDARAARWIYLGLAVAAVALALVRRRPTSAVVSFLLGGLLGIATLLDGPVVPLCVAAVGAIWSARARQPHRAPEDERVPPPG